MQFQVAAITLAALTGVSSALPRADTRDYPSHEAHLTFHGGPASYPLTVPTDGSVVPTNNDLSISLISAPDYEAYTGCTFYTNGRQTLTWDASARTIAVGPPQPVFAVRCGGGQ